MCFRDTPLSYCQRSPFFACGKGLGSNSLLPLWDVAFPLLYIQPALLTGAWDAWEGVRDISLPVPVHLLMGEDPPAQSLYTFDYCCTGTNCNVRFILMWLFKKVVSLYSPGQPVRVRHNSDLHI